MNSIKLAILGLCLALSATSAQESRAEEESMIEFCTALQIVAQDANEYEAWKERYEPDMAVVVHLQNVLHTQIALKNITMIEVYEAALACRYSREEEMRP